MNQLSKIIERIGRSETKTILLKKAIFISLFLNYFISGIAHAHVNNEQYFSVIFDYSCMLLIGTGLCSVVFFVFNILYYRMPVR